jgi:amino acid permease
MQYLNGVGYSYFGSYFWVCPISAFWPMARWNFGCHCMFPVDLPTCIGLTITRIKILALIAFFILAICISTGGVGPQPIGFKYWHDPGPFADSINGVARTFVVAGTLYAGTEM